MKAIFNNSFTYKTLYTFLLLFVALCGCTRGDEQGKLPANVLVEAGTEVDSTYIKICSADSKEIIPEANRFFYQLYQLEVTDTLTQYGTDTPISLVQANAAYWMGEYLLAEERYDEAISVADVALSLAKEMSNESLANETHSLLSVIYFRKGLVNDAIENLKVCFDYDSRM